ncbi:MAG: hypothetical protein U0271_36465 [Polyangiaceae bacterium]
MGDREKSGSIEDVIEADRAEAEAWTDLFAAAAPPFAAAVGLSASTSGGATVLLAAKIPEPLFNRAIGLGNEAPATEDELDAVLQLARARGPSRFWVHVGRAAQPDALARWLEARGLVAPARATWAKVVRRREPPPVVSTDLAVRVVEPSERADLGAVIAAAHGMPPPMAPWVAALAGRPRWTAYGAFDGSTLVGGGLVFVSGPRAWLGLGGTAVSHRRRGAQGAVMAARIAHALEAGAHLTVTETGEPKASEENPSLRNMARCGFVKVDSRRNFELALG